MFSRLSALIKTAYQYCTSTLSSLVVSDIPAAATMKDGVSIQTFRLLFNTMHAVTIKPVCPPEQAADMLRAVMNSTEPDARSAYDRVNHLSSSNFFLSMNDAKAWQLKQLLSTALRKNHQQLSTEADVEIEKMLTFLREQTGLTSSVNCYITHSVRAFIIRALTGLELTTAVQEMLDIDSAELNGNDFGFMPGMPYFFRFLSGGFRALRNKWHQVIDEFLRVELLRLSKATLAESNFLMILVLMRFPDRDFAALVADPDILKQIIADPDIRLAVIGAIGADNLAKAVIAALKVLFIPSLGRSIRHRDIIYAELSAMAERTEDMTELNVTDEKVFPYLHAFWLETLRCYPPMPDIMRYTAKGMQAGHVTIPPKSFIKLVFPLFAKVGNDKFDTAIFEPVRHLNNENSRLHNGYLTPFGIGERMCPAHRISELTFKKIVVALVLNFRDLRADRIECTSLVKKQQRVVKSLHLQLF